MAETQKPDPTENGGRAVALDEVWSAAQAMHEISTGGRAAQVLTRALASFAASPLVSAITVLTIALALLLFSFFLLLMQNARSALDASRPELTLSIYLKDGADQAQVDKLKTELRETAGVAAVAFIDKSAALDALRGMLAGQADVLDGLGTENPLPASLEVKAGSGGDAEVIFGTLSNRYRENPVVEQVKYNAGLVWQLASLLKVLRNAGFFAVGLMVLVTSFIIYNTIKLALYSRREELEIMRLVGATRAFVRLPCLLEGLLQGLAGAIIALAGTHLFSIGLKGAVEDSEILRLLLPQFEFLAMRPTLLVLTFGIFVGMVGSSLAARPFVNER